LDALLDLTVRRVAEGLEAELAKVLEYMPAEKRLLMRAGVGFARTCGCSAQLRAIHAAPRCRRMTPRTYECLRGYPKGKEGCGMTDKTTIEINVDTFTDRDSYFVRTEVEKHALSASTAHFLILKLRKSSRQTSSRAGRMCPRDSRRRYSRSCRHYRLPAHSGLVS